MDEPVGRRCEMGCETWPDKALYAHCLRCGEPTRRVRGRVTPLSDEEAESILKAVAFERYYERWCAARRQPVEGPLSDLSGIKL